MTCLLFWFRLCPTLNVHVTNENLLDFIYNYSRPSLQLPHSPPLICLLSLYRPHLRDLEPVKNRQPIIVSSLHRHLKPMYTTSLTLKLLVYVTHTTLLQNQNLNSAPLWVLDRILIRWSPWTKTKSVGGSKTTRKRWRSLNWIEGAKIPRKELIFWSDMRRRLRISSAITVVKTHGTICRRPLDKISCNCDCKQ